MKKPNQLKIRSNELFDIHQMLIAVINTTKKSFVLMGKLLYELKKDNNFKKTVGDGIETWKQYLAQPEINLSTGEASRMIQIYEQFIQRLGFSEEIISEVPLKNLHYLLPMVKKTDDKDLVGEWLADATLLSQSDFRQRIGELRDEEYTYEYEVMKRCKETGKLSKVGSITHEMILEAFKQQIYDEERKGD